MKATRRHELEHNQLADALTKWGATLQPYARIFVGGAVLLVAALLSYWYVSKSNAQQNGIAWDVYNRAFLTGEVEKLRDLANEMPGTIVGDWSRLAVAESELSEGVEVFRNKTEAPAKLQSAVKGFGELRGSKDRMTAQRALFGQARAHEALIAFAENPKNTLNLAVGEYEALAEQFPGGPFAETAKRRASDLKKSDTRDFYDWLSRWQPPFDPKKDFGTPGKTDFDTSLDRLPDNSLLNPGASKPATGPALPVESDDTPPSSKTPKEGAADPEAPAESDTPPAGEAPAETEGPPPGKQPADRPAEK